MKLCHCGCGKEVRKNNKFIIGHNRKGMKDSIETREKKSIMMKGVSKSEDHKKKLSGINNGMYGKTHTDENKELFRQQNYIRFSNVDERYKIGNGVRQFYMEHPEAREKKSIMMKGNNCSRNVKEYKPSSIMGIQNRDKGLCQNPACFIPHKLIDVHHIDKDTSNNILENLVTLCRNCHAKIHSILETK